MTITTADLAAAVGADETRDATALTRALDAANADLDRVLASTRIDGATGEPIVVPDGLRDIWTLDTASNYFKRTVTSDGGFSTGPDSTGVPGVANDPLQKSWPAIKRYINRL